MVQGSQQVAEEKFSALRIKEVFFSTILHVFLMDVHFLHVEPFVLDYFLECLYSKIVLGGRPCLSNDKSSLQFLKTGIYLSPK